MMDTYSIFTKKNWLETRREISEEMRKWGISDWIAEQKGSTAKLTYMKDGRTVELIMDKQARAQDNLRVLFLAIQAIRLNELRGISDVVRSAYLQLEAAQQKLDPYQVLGVLKSMDLEEIEAIYKVKARRAHPDNGGTAEQMKALNEAIAEIRKEKSNG